MELQIQKCLGSFYVDMKIPYKTRLWVGDILILLSVFVVFGTIIYSNYSAPAWAIILLSSIASISFIVGFVFIPKTNEDGSPIVINKKEKKPKKTKKPFMSDKEWKEQEIEDDEMAFIEEHVEDD